MRTLVIAPHADDELLGCGGTLLRRIEEGGDVGWILMTDMVEGPIWSSEAVERRALEIDQVRMELSISPSSFFAYRYPTGQLDLVPMSELVTKISKSIEVFRPDEVFLPFPGDAHSDHRVTFDAASAASKYFRAPSIRRILVYETPSETDFDINPCRQKFDPSVYINIAGQFEKKIALLKIYKDELGDFPFPRSFENLKSLARVGGAQSGFSFAERFMLLREYL